ncbi:hypothetical protein INT43_007673, partial [Umbelopsis isabellina]
MASAPGSDAQPKADPKEQLVEDGKLVLDSVSGRRHTYDTKMPFYGDCRDVDDFKKLNRVGEGTYGVVYRVKDTKKGSICALKRIRMEGENDGLPVSSLREIMLLKRMRHRNIVNVTDVAVGPQLESIFLVMEYCEQDMGTLMDAVPTPYTPSEVKCLMLQLLEGLEYCHRNQIIHRDLKLSNLLLTHEGILKIADFGLARSLSLPSKPMTPKVVTLWYRAPELLFGESHYTTAVDMWSVGCIFGELMKHKPLLPGNTEQKEIELIVKLIGSPNETIWPGFSKLPFAKSLILPQQEYSNLKLEFPRATDHTLNLLSGLLTYNHKVRTSVRQALKHPYFIESPRPLDPSLLPTYPEIRNQISEKEKTRRAHDEERKKRIAHLDNDNVFGVDNFKKRK